MLVDIIKYLEGIGPIDYLVEYKIGETLELCEADSWHVYVGEDPISANVILLQTTAVPELNIVHPYVPRSHSYKGQTHFHSTCSDGLFPPDELVAMYRDAGYDFVNMTDHNVAAIDPNVSGILFIKGDEDNGSVWTHIGSANVEHDCTTPTPQAVIDFHLAAGSFVTVNHPSWSSLTAAQINDLIGWHAIEICNYATIGNNEEPCWDELLALGRLTYGIAVDDTHIAIQFNKAWVHVFADELTVTAIIVALKAGNYYCSTGPILAVSVIGQYLTVTTPDPATIEWIKNGQVVNADVGLTSSHCVFEPGFVRARITRLSDGKRAWTQPFQGESL
jgi:hypothetical protein